MNIFFALKGSKLFIHERFLSYWLKEGGIFYFRRGPASRFVPPVMNREDEGYGVVY